MTREQDLQRIESALRDVEKQHQDLVSGVADLKRVIRSTGLDREVAEGICRTVDLTVARAILVGHATGA